MFYYGLSRRNKTVPVCCLPGSARVVNAGMQRSCRYFSHSKFSQYFQVESEDPFPLAILSPLLFPSFSPSTLLSPPLSWWRWGWKGQAVLAGSSTTVMAFGFCKHGSWSLADFCQRGQCAEHCPARQGLMRKITSHHRHPNELCFLRTFQHC